MHRGKSMTPWRGAPLDLPSSQSDGSYRELSERNGLELTQGHSTIVRGGVHHAAMQGGSQEGYEFVDLERGFPENRIQKTVRVETLS